MLCRWRKLSGLSGSTAGDNMKNAVTCALRKQETEIQTRTLSQNMCFKPSSLCLKTCHRNLFWPSVNTNESFHNVIWQRFVGRILAIADATVAYNDGECGRLDIFTELGMQAWVLVLLLPADIQRSGQWAYYWSWHAGNSSCADSETDSSLCSGSAGHEWRGVLLVWGPWMMCVSGVLYSSHTQHWISKFVSLCMHVVMYHVHMIKMCGDIMAKCLQWIF